MLKNLRDRDLHDLIARAKEAVRYRKLVVIERTIISRLKIRYNKLIIKYKRVRESEISSRRRIVTYKREERRYEGLEKRARIDIRRYEILIRRYRERRVAFEDRVRMIKTKEVELRRRVRIITKKELII